MRCASCKQISFQFTPLREGRQQTAIEKIYSERISIHAPPRGATAAVDAEKKALDISIHAPPRGATTAELIDEVLEKFQFTPLREGRLTGLNAEQIYYFISIHAPPRGATLLVHTSTARTLFQFTPLREGRQDVMPGLSQYVISIHAPPRGATCAGAWRLLGLLDFNSRPSARGDSLPHHVGRAGHISIHAPPRGATSDLAIATGQKVFQFTPLREGRPRWLYTQPSFSRHFNSRPSARGDIFEAVHVVLGQYFNSRPSARGDTPHRAYRDAP